MNIKIHISAYTPRDKEKDETREVEKKRTIAGKWTNTLFVNCLM